MKRSNLKYYIGISLLFIVDSIHNFFHKSYEMIDVYLLIDYERYIQNVVYDVSNLFTFSILTYYLIEVNKRIFKPLFITSLFTWLSYFTFYNQASSLLLIPIYLILVVYYNQNLFR